ncbi:MAG: AMP-binding protein [Actinomycetota bacterium]
MGYPGTFAGERGDHPAVIMTGSGDVRTYAELDAESNRLARLLRAQGLVAGDHVALFMENQIRYYDVVWAALRTGIQLTLINSYLTAEEAAYIVDDCDARLVISSRARAEAATGIDPATTPGVERWLMIDGLPAAGDESGPTWESYEDAVAPHPPTAVDDECPGGFMLYSSGTTGRPKGVVRPVPEGSVHELDSRTERFLIPYFGYAPDMVYLSPAPLYHAAPMAYGQAVHRVGGTVVVMERFDAAACLAALDRYDATHSQFVPTMFVRMLKLAADERAHHDLSSLRYAIHAAAPCPVPVKRDMIEWWGPVLYEYYAGSEGNGATVIDSEEWLAHPGSVGRPRPPAAVHNCDDDGNELPAGETGGVYFSGGGAYHYHKAPEKTAAAALPGGRTTLGDIGYVDDDGYLYLTDRKANMIIAGGVNIYPQEIESVLIGHPAVADVAVFGVPDPDLGEQVKAVIQLLDPAGADDETAATTLAAELLAYCGEHLARYKVPRSIDFEADLPRLPTGKLYKRLLRDRYWGRTTSTIV